MPLLCDEKWFPDSTAPSAMRSDIAQCPNSVAPSTMRSDYSQRPNFVALSTMRSDSSMHPDSTAPSAFALPATFLPLLPVRLEGVKWFCFSIVFSCQAFLF